MSNVKKNFAYQLCYQILLSILPFITSPYLARVLGSESIGIYAYTFSIITYFKMFAALGIANYGNRLIAQVKDQQDKLNRAFSSLFTLHAILTMIVIVAYLVYWGTFVKENQWTALIQIIYLFAELLDINWFFFGMEKFKLTVIRNFIIRILTVICVFVIVKNENDLWKYVLILATGILISNLSIWAFWKKFARFVKFSMHEMVSHIKPMLVLFFSVIAISVYSYMDKIMLGKMGSMTELGYYENAWKMIEFPSALVTALGTVMMPKISNLVVKGNKEEIDQYMYSSMRFSLLAAIAIAFGVAGISHEFSVMFWGSEFAASGSVMFVMSPVIVLIAFNTVVRMQYLIPRECDKVYLKAVTVGAIVNVIANYILIPQYGAIGAGIGTVFAYVGICAVQTAFVWNRINVKIYLLASIPYVIIGAIMFFVIRRMGNALESTILTVIIQVMVGVLIFVSGSLIYAFIAKDKFVIDKIKKVC